jgi:hypothetical protein
LNGSPTSARCFQEGQTELYMNKMAERRAREFAAANTPSLIIGSAGKGFVWNTVVMDGGEKVWGSNEIRTNREPPHRATGFKLLFN